MKRAGANVVLHGTVYDHAEEEALRMAKEKGLPFISPYNHPDVVAGQGTVGMEIMLERPDTVLTFSFSNTNHTIGCYTGPLKRGRLIFWDCHRC